MGKINLLIVSALLFALTGNLSAQCVQTDKKFYIGIGSGFSTYVGGEFGDRFAMRISSSRYYNDDYYNNYYYNRYNNYYDDNYYDDNTSFNPLQMNFILGVKTSKLISIELNTGIIWHGYGDPPPVYETGIYGDYDYTDRFDNSSFFAVPIMTTFKLYPLWTINAPLYLSFSYGVQYSHEKLSRIRELYSANSNYGNNGNYSYPIAEYSDSRWLHGFSVGIGYSYRIFEHLSGDLEFSYTNFFSEYKTGSPLAMNNTGNIGSISLGTKIYIGL